MLDLGREGGGRFPAKSAAKGVIGMVEVEEKFVKQRADVGRGECGRKMTPSNPIF